MKWTLLKASEEFGVARETIRRGLSAAGIECKPKASFTTHEICAAIFGDLKKERARLAAADASLREIELKQAEGELIPLADNLAWQDRVLAPIRQRLIALPSLMAQRCNPVDPQFAQAALDSWLDETLPMLRIGIEESERGRARNAKDK